MSDASTNNRIARMAKKKSTSQSQVQPKHPKPRSRTQLKTQHSKTSKKMKKHKGKIRMAESNKKQSATEIGNFLVNLASSKKKNTEASSNLQDYVFGFDVPKSVATQLRNSDSDSENDNGIGIGIENIAEETCVNYVEKDDDEFQFALIDCSDGDESEVDLTTSDVDALPVGTWCCC